MKGYRLRFKGGGGEEGFIGKGVLGIGGGAGDRDNRGDPGERTKGLLP